MIGEEWMVDDTAGMKPTVNSFLSPNGSDAKLSSTHYRIIILSPLFTT